MRCVETHEDRRLGKTLRSWQETGTSEVYMRGSEREWGVFVSAHPRLLESPLRGRIPPPTPREFSSIPEPHLFVLKGHPKEVPWWSRQREPDFLLCFSDSWHDGAVDGKGGRVWRRGKTPLGVPSSHGWVSNSPSRTTGTWPVAHGVSRGGQRSRTGCNCEGTLLRHKSLRNYEGESGCLGDPSRSSKEREIRLF